MLLLIIVRLWIQRIKILILFVPRIRYSCVGETE